MANGRCLGLDPGIGTLGWGLVSSRGDCLVCEAYGVVQTPPRTPLPDRLLLLYDDLRRRTGDMNPSVVAVERLFFGRNTTTAEMVWQARGVVLLYAAQLGVPVYEPTPPGVKMAVCGSGRADKHQVQMMVQHLLALESVPRPDDAADALAVAIAGLTMWQMSCREVQML